MWFDLILWYINHWWSLMPNSLYIYIYIYIYIRGLAEKFIDRNVHSTISYLLLILVSASHQTGLDTSSMTQKPIIVRVKGGESSYSQELNPAWLYWPSAHLVQCQPDEPCWIWAEIKVQAWMPDNRFNWTKKSSAIQCCQWHYQPLKGSPAKAGSFSA